MEDMIETKPTVGSHPELIHQRYWSCFVYRMLLMSVVCKWGWLGRACFFGCMTEDCFLKQVIKVVWHFFWLSISCPWNYMSRNSSSLKIGLSAPKEEAVYCLPLPLFFRGELFSFFGVYLLDSECDASINFNHQLMLSAMWWCLKKDSFLACSLKIRLVD